MDTWKFFTQLNKISRLAVCCIQNSCSTKGVNGSTKLFPNCIFKMDNDLHILLVRADLLLPLHTKIHFELIRITFPATENTINVKHSKPMYDQMNTTRRKISTSGV